MDGALSLPEFEVSLRRDGDVVVRVAGEVDLATAPRLRAGLEQAIEANGDVVVDLADVTFIDPTGLKVLIEARGCLQSTHRRIQLVRPSRPVRRLLGLTGLNGFFDEGVDVEVQR